MTSWNNVLKYIKNRIALPSSFIEVNDAQIKEHLINIALSEFSTYFPDVNRVSVITDNENYKVHNKNNQYYIFDPDDLDIITIKECYFNLSDAIMNNAPLIGPTSMESMKWWALSAFTSNFVNKFSDFKPTYKFIEPNIVEVIRGMSGETSNEVFVVEYEREQPHDLSKIPRALDSLFKELCLGYTQLWIGSIRSSYQGITTPFGDIPLNADFLVSEGKENIERCREIMNENTIISVIMDVD